MGDNKLEFQFLEEQLLVGIVVMRDEKVIYSNRVFAEIFDYPIAEIMTWDSAVLEKIIHSDDKETVISRFKKRLAGEPGLPQQYDYRILTKKGDTKWVTMHAQRLNYEGTVTLVFFFIDITERKKTEEALRESEHRYRTIFNNTAVSIWEYDFKEALDRLNRLKKESITDYRMFFSEHPNVAREIIASIKPVDVNETTLELYGAATKEELVASYGKHLTPESYMTFIEAFVAYLEGKRYFETETINETLDGRQIYILNGITFPFTDGENARALVTVTDITEIKHMEEALTKASKLESIGILAGGIAHDFNNLLAAIMGNISLALTEVDNRARVHKLLNEAEKACGRAQGLTQQLLTFSKGGEPVRETVSIDALLRESVMFSLIGSNVTACFSIDDELQRADIDKSQIDQAINNIIINAVQAMPGGGIISVSAENVTINDYDGLPLTVWFRRLSPETIQSGRPEERTQPCALQKEF